MSPIIAVTNLSKKYSLGTAEPYYTLRDTLMDLFRNPVASVKNTLTKDEFWALQDLNFTVNQGEMVGIIGRNGAGKSTLLKVLSQITPPTTGEVVLRGRVGSLLEVGTGFHPELTGRENIFLNGAVLGMRQSEVKKKFEEIVEFAEVEKFLDTPLKRYSSGMYMRLAFAVAAHLEPDILIVDEVLAVGDAEFQKKTIGKMSDMAQAGRTVLFVSHNLGLVAHLCSRVIVLNSGKILFSGEPAQAVDAYVKSKKEETSKRIEVNKIFEHVRLHSVAYQSSGMAWTLPFREPLKLKVLVTLAKSISNFRLGVGVTSESRERVMTVHSQPFELKTGEHAIEVEIDTLLNPGYYFLSIGALHLFNVADVCMFEVINSDKIGPLHELYNVGYFDPTAKFTRLSGKDT